jgi:hypothetical protein
MAQYGGTALGRLRRPCAGDAEIPRGAQPDPLHPQPRPRPLRGGTGRHGVWAQRLRQADAAGNPRSLARQGPQTVGGDRAELRGDRRYAFLCQPEEMDAALHAAPALAQAARHAHPGQRADHRSTQGLPRPGHRDLARSGGATAD